MRRCTHCGNVVVEGYCIDNGFEYYCSDECLYENYTQDGYLELYDRGFAYYSQWREETLEDWKETLTSYSLEEFNEEDLELIFDFCVKHDLFMNEDGDGTLNNITIEFRKMELEKALSYEKVELLSVDEDNQALAFLGGWYQNMEKILKEEN